MYREVLDELVQVAHLWLQCQLGSGGAVGATDGVGGMFMVLRWSKKQERLLQGYTLADSRMTNNEQYMLVALFNPGLARWSVIVARSMYVCVLGPNDQP